MTLPAHRPGPPEAKVHDADPAPPAELRASRRRLLLGAWRWTGRLLAAGALLGAWRTLRGARPVVREEVLSPDLLARARAEGGVTDGAIFVTDPKGTPEALSLRCTHLGCRVARDAEGGFACRCHGSRYDAEGRPIAGPAQRPLARAPVLRRGDRWVVRVDEDLA